jgi:hypothetical protein
MIERERKEKGDKEENEGNRKRKKDSKIGQLKRENQMIYLSLTTIYTSKYEKRQKT